MDLRLTPEQEKLRREICEFLQKEVLRDKYPRDDDQWMKGFSPEFSRKLGERGWIGMTWPPEYGGGGRSYLDRLIVTEELLRYGAPCSAHWIADRQVGPAILNYGSEGQRKDFLPRIIKGELYFALGLSEPEAGSDLASLRTQAIEERDEFVINGQKVWTSGAQRCHYLYMVARTDTNVPKHRGISEFIIALDTPGITIKPIMNPAGAEDFNEVFFDDVHVPKESLIGEKNRGWYQISAQLDYERSGIERLMSNYTIFEDIIEHVKKMEPGKDQLIRHKLADLQVKFEIGRLFIYRVAWLLSQGILPNYEAAMAKAYCTDFEKELANAVTQILGLYGQLMPGSKWARLNGRAAITHLWSIGFTIQGGTSEVLRNIVATRGLGLPTA